MGEGTKWESWRPSGDGVRRSNCTTEEANVGHILSVPLLEFDDEVGGCSNGGVEGSSRIK